MAEFRINVVVDPSGARRGTQQVENDLNRVGTAADNVRRLIRQAFVFAGVTVGVRQIVGLIDTYTNLQNRLRLVTADTQNLADVTGELFEISNRTRSSFEATAQLYSRVALATRDLGISQRETLQFAESLNQAVILSGAAAQEAEAGLLQLSQGLASGTLRGDELRSVLEQIPFVADVIADSLGVTRGELRQLGTDGAITADVVIQAFAEAREELAGRFAETIPTIGQAFTILRNNVLQLVGGFDQASGASQAFARVIIFLAENVETLARVAAATGIALGVDFARRGVVAATRAVNALTVAIAANPIGAIAVAITVAVSALTAFSDQIRVSATGFTTLADLGLAAFQLISEGVANVINFISENFGGVATLFQSVFGDVELTFEGVLTTAATVVDTMIGLFEGTARAIVAAFQSIPAGLEAIFVGTFNSIARLNADFINGVIDGLNVIPGIAIDAFEPTLLTASSSFGDIGSNVANAFAEGFNSSTQATDAVTALFDRADEIARDRIAQLPPVVASQLDATGTRTAGTGGTAGAGAGGRGASDALREQREELERLTRITQELNGVDEDLLQRQTDLNFLLANGAITAEQFAAAMRDLNVESTALDNSFSGGLANGLARVAQQANELGSQFSDFVVGAFGQATDAIVEFARTGEVNLRQFFQDLFSQLLRLAANQLFSQLIGSLIGGGGGGGGLGALLGGGGGGGLLGFQNGGSFAVGGSGGTDSQLVAFRATPNERVTVETPGQQRMSDRGGETVVTSPPPNVLVQITPGDITGALSGSDGDDFLVQGIERNARSIRSVLGR